MTRSLEDRVRMLEDQQEIAKLKARYVNYNDGGWNGPTHAHPQAVADLFSDDATWDGRPSTGFAEGRAQIIELFKTFGAVPFIVHYVTNPIIDVDGDTATGHWHALVTMTVPGDQALWSLGLYIDEFVRTATGWKFQSLRFESAANSPYELGWGKQRMLYAADPFKDNSF